MINILSEKRALKDNEVSHNFVPLMSISFCDRYARYCFIVAQGPLLIMTTGKYSPFSLHDNYPREKKPWENCNYFKKSNWTYYNPNPKSLLTSTMYKQKNEVIVLQVL